MRYFPIFLLILSSCIAKTPLPISAPTVEVKSDSPETLEARRESCKTLLDHLVNMATDGYIKEHGIVPGSEEAKDAKVMAFATLASRGVISRFMLACMTSFKKDVIACELKANTFDKIEACEGKTSDPEPESPPPVKSY